MKEYADQIRGKIVGIMENLSNTNELDIYARLGQLTEIRQNINTFQRGDLLDEGEVQELEKLQSDNYKILRDKLLSN